MGFKTSGIEGKIFRRSKKLSIVEGKFRFVMVKDRGNSIRESGIGFKRVKEEMVRFQIAYQYFLSPYRPVLMSLVSRKNCGISSVSSSGSDPI